jgi:hypothetical protein
VTLREKLAETIRTGVTVGFQDEVVNAAEVADAAILALRQWMDAEGLAIVPREATGEMFQAAHAADPTAPHLTPGEWRLAYRAMIAAAPDALREGEKT